MNPAMLEPAVSTEFELQPLLWTSRYADDLYAFAMLRVNNDEQAKDLVQDTFLAALENAKSFKKMSTEKTWLTAILKNKIFDFYRRQFKESSDLPPMHDHFFRKEDGHWNREHWPVDFVTSQLTTIETKERVRLLLTCIRKLPPTWQIVFKMKHLEDLSTVVICRALNLTPANFWVINHRAKLYLRSCLEKHL